LLDVIAPIPERVIAGLPERIAPPRERASGAAACKENPIRATNAHKMPTLPRNWLKGLTLSSFLAAPLASAQTEAGTGVHEYRLLATSRAGTDSATVTVMAGETGVGGSEVVVLSVSRAPSFVSRRSPASESGWSRLSRRT
jgi:hypothetical protein